MLTVPRFFRDLVPVFEEKMKKNFFLVWAILFLFYFGKYWPEANGVIYYFRLVFESFSIYVGQNLLFDGEKINPLLGAVPISPTNAFFIYPPGTYLAAALLGSVKNTLLFSFFCQASVPVAIYEILCTATHRLVAFLLALVVMHYSVVIALHPDYTVQVLTLWIVVVFLKQGGGSAEPSMPKLFSLGLLCGLVMLFKHNIGVFLVYGCLCLLFFKHIDFSGSAGASIFSRPFFFLSVLLNFMVCLFLLSKMIFWDEVFYFILPLAMYWAATLYLFLREKGQLQFGGKKFLTNAIFFGASSLLIPGFVFFKVGSVVGFSRYFYSLFGMGFEYIKSWDYGIFHIIDSYVNFSLFSSPLSWGANYNSLVLLMIFLLPVILMTGFAFLFFFRREICFPKGSQKNFEILSWLIFSAAFSLGFFPLEDFRNIQTKFFILVFCLLLLWRAYVFSSWQKGLLLLLCLFLFLGTLPSYRKAYALTQQASEFGSGVLREKIGLRMHPDLAKELERAILFIKEKTSGEHFFLINFSSQVSLPLLAMLDPPGRPNFYLEMRDSMLSAEVVSAIKEEINGTGFVVIRDVDYDSYIAGTLSEKHASIVRFLVERFVSVGKFEFPEESVMFSGHSGYYILRKK